MGFFFPSYCNLIKSCLKHCVVVNLISLCKFTFKLCYSLFCYQKVAAIGGEKKCFVEPLNSTLRKIVMMMEKCVISDSTTT